MLLTDKVAITRRTMVLFFVIDVSGSMDGNKIGTVNETMAEVIPALKELSADNPEAQIKMAVLEFSSGTHWITANGPEEVEHIRGWKYVDAAGVTDFGAACKALNEKLSTKGFMRDATGSYAPVIFLMSDSEPTDDRSEELELLKQNKWFKAGVKFALAIGDDANKEVLKELPAPWNRLWKYATPLD